MPFISNTDEQRREMLAAIGVSDIESLFADIPPNLRCGDLDIASGKTEQEVRSQIAALAEHNSTGLVNFLGGGFYDHFIPAAVSALIAPGGET